MLSARVIPCLLNKDSSLVKTIKFNEVNYIGDPVNTIQIFNNFEVDELVLLDIAATNAQRPPKLELIRNVANECFMPLAYGGGIRDIETISKIFGLGSEKAIICSYAAENPEFVRLASRKFGNQSIIVAIDVKKNFFGKYEVFTHSGKKNTKKDPIEFARLMQEMGAGEIFLNSIDLDGTMAGYDLGLVNDMTHAITIPLIACGGAGSHEDLKKAIKAGASAAAAGSLFVYQGKDLGVLINFPSQKELEEIRSI